MSPCQATADDGCRSSPLGSRRRRLSQLPAARRMARGGRRREASCLPRRGLLVARRARVRRPEGVGARARARSRGARRQPHRAHLHRRPLRRLAVPGDVPGRLRQPADLRSPRRRARAARRVGHVGGEVRAAREPPAAVRARRLPPVPGARGGRARQPPRGRVPRRVRLRGGVPPVRRQAAPEVRPRGGGGRGRADPAVLVPPEPAEHVHRPVDRADVRRRVRARQRARLSRGPRSAPRPPGGARRRRRRCRAG